ncbi:probable G-protein coupled receptor 27 [Amblyraja radiata]|uniref:probable G-protein coupled receptor 27 n=1 Tax=Amblyraja radiata TaxID=386614 RepID=UPI0014042585|nr:probable G-protein coupled receptor 27 [Amblyraja radiata]XP_055503662.1 probable G-protein coupled receptor 27 [Leucoraja erinacea]
MLVSMANASELEETNSSLQNYAITASAVKLASLGLIICISLTGNLLLSFLLFKEPSLHRAPYYFLLDLCLADIVRSLLCFPFVMISISSGSAWTYSLLSCKIIAFAAVLFCFHAAFMMFCISITRYMAIAHHRFYSKRMTVWTCVAVICMVWTLSVAMAFPPVFDVGTYKFIRGEEQCIFEHRYVKANDTLGFMLMLAVIIAATHMVYVKLIFFVYDHRKMKPAQLIPAISQNWTFHGPGATGQAAANWIAGFGRGPTPPTLVGIRQTTHNQNKRLLVLDEFKMEKRIGRMFYIITVLFLLLWSPYIVACYLRVFVKASTIPQVYLTAAVWMTFAQAGVNPILCFIFNKELRICFRTHFPCFQSTQTPREAYCVI